jgi:hypothetical protein
MLIFLHKADAYVFKHMAKLGLSSEGKNIDNVILKDKFGHNREKVTGRRRKLYNEERHTFDCLPDVGILGFDSRRELGIFLFTTASRTALEPTQPPIQWVPGALSLGVKRPGREADHSSPSNAEVKE